MFLSLSPWMTPGPDFPYQFAANFENESGENQHIILKYKESPVPGLYISYKMINIMEDGPDTLEGNFRIYQIRYKDFSETFDNEASEEVNYGIEYTPADNPLVINNLTLTNRVSESETGGYFVSHKVNNVSERIEIDEESYNHTFIDVHTRRPLDMVQFSPNGPLPNPISGGDLVRGNHYHVYTREGSGFKHEGHGRFDSRHVTDVLFAPFTLGTGAVLESQVFDVSDCFFYKTTNIKGGKRTTRKTKKSRKSRKSHRNMRR